MDTYEIYYAVSDKGLIHLTFMDFEKKLVQAAYIHEAKMLTQENYEKILEIANIDKESAKNGIYDFEEILKNLNDERKKEIENILNNSPEPLYFYDRFVKEEDLTKYPYFYDVGFGQIRKAEFQSFSTYYYDGDDPIYVSSLHAIDAKEEEKYTKDDIDVYLMKTENGVEFELYKPVGKRWYIKEINGSLYDESRMLTVDKKEIPKPGKDLIDNLRNAIMEIAEEKSNKEESNKSNKVNRKR